MFRKISLILTVMAISVMLFSTPVLADTDYDYVTQVDLTIGQKVALIDYERVTMDQAAYVKNGRTLVPFRFLAEALGAEVSWDNNTRTARLVLRGLDVKVPIGSKVAYINNNASTLDVPAETTGGRTFVPLRFVSEALGAEVDYDSKAKSISIISMDTSGWSTFKDPIGGNLIFPQNWTLTGDISTVLKLTSPSDSIISVQRKQGEFDKIVSDKKNEYTEKGYKVLSEDPSDPDNPNAGTVITFNKVDGQDSFGVVAAIIKAPDGIYTNDIESNMSNLMIDSMILSKIFLSEEEFQQWESIQK